MLRSGVTESGKVAYIPQLQTCRVVDGSSVATDARVPSYSGLRAYDPARAAMVQVAGLHRDTAGRTEVGLWKVDPHDTSAAQTLQLGVRFHTVQASGGMRMHHIDFVSTISEQEVRIGLRVTDTRAEGNAVLVTMTVALGRDVTDGTAATGAGCVSFKMNHFLPRAKLASFLERANSNALFNDLPFSFEPAQPTQSSDAKHAANHVRYRLAHRCFLQCWQAAIASVAADVGQDRNALMTALSVGAPTHVQLTQQIDADRDVLREVLLQSYDAIRMTLTQRDAYGECLFYHLMPLFLASTSAQDAPVQCLLGATLASGCGGVQADAVLAAEFFELAARHAQRGSYAGLGKLHEDSQAGLDVDISNALGTYQQGALRGDDAALVAMSALAMRLAAEHAAAFGSGDELAHPGVTRADNARTRGLGRLRALFRGGHFTSRR